MELIIDSELQNFFPKLSENELILLEENIKLGIIEPRLLVWKDKNIIIDGHNTYKICKKLEHKFEIKEIEVETKEQALLLMIQAQFGRRNLTQLEESYYRGLVTERLTRNKKSKPLNTSAATLEEFAEEREVSLRTLYYDRDYSQGVNSISETLEVPPTQVIGSSLTKKEVIEITKEVPEMTLTQLEQKLRDKNNQKKPRKVEQFTSEIKENDLVQIIYTKNCEELNGYKTSYAIARTIREYSLDLSIWDKFIPCVPLDNVRLVKTTVDRMVQINPTLLSKIMNAFSSLEEALKSIDFPDISREKINEGDKVKVAYGQKKDWTGIVQTVFTGSYFTIKLDYSGELETFCLDDLTLQE